MSNTTLQVIEPIVVKDKVIFKLIRHDQRKFRLNSIVNIKDKDGNDTGKQIESPRKTRNKRNEFVPVPMEWGGTTTWEIPNNGEDYNRDLIKFLRQSPQNASHPMYNGQGHLSPVCMYYEFDPNVYVQKKIQAQQDAAEAVSALQSKIGYFDSNNNGALVLIDEVKLRACAFALGVEIKTRGGQDVPYVTVMIDIFTKIPQNPADAKEAILGMDAVHKYFIHVLKTSGVFRERHRKLQFRVDPNSEYIDIGGSRQFSDIMENPEKNAELLQTLERSYFKHTGGQEIDLMRRELAIDQAADPATLLDSQQPQQ